MKLLQLLKELEDNLKELIQDLKDNPDNKLIKEMISKYQERIEAIKRKIQDE